jgi:hypothetical protein
VDLRGSVGEEREFVSKEKKLEKKSLLRKQGDDLQMKREYIQNVIKNIH